MIGIRCHLCRERFSWDIMKGYPTHCECCHQFIGIADDAPEVATPYISTPQKRGRTDAIYRDMETKSIARAEMAASETGQTLAEVAHLKMTDMKDNLKEGDQAFSSNLQNNPVQQAMNQAPQGSVGFGNNAAAIAASAGTRQGPLPNAGTNFIHGMGGLRDKHATKYHAPVSSMPGHGTRTR